MPIRQTVTTGLVCRRLECSTEGESSAGNDWVPSVIHYWAFVTGYLGVQDHFSSILAGSVARKKSHCSQITILSLFILLSHHTISL